MQYKKQSTVSGAWAKAQDIQSGTKCRLVSECKPVPSQFQDKNGKLKEQNVAKVKYDGIEEALNTSLNRATIDGLVDAFGEDSVEWQGHDLTVQTEKMIVGGKRVTALYLIPDGYKLGEDESGFMHIFPDVPTVTLD